jgi:hypothetical protein
MNLLSTEGLTDPISRAKDYPYTKTSKNTYSKMAWLSPASARKKLSLTMRKIRIPITGHVGNCPYSKSKLE